MISEDPFKRLNNAEQEFISLKDTFYYLREKYQNKSIAEIARCLLNELCNQRRCPVYEQLPGGLLKITDDKYNSNLEKLPQAYPIVKDHDSHTFLFNLLLNVDNKGESVFTERVITEKHLKMLMDEGYEGLIWRTDLYNADYERFGLKRSELKSIFGFDFTTKPNNNSTKYIETKWEQDFAGKKIALEIIAGLSMALSSLHKKFKNGDKPNASELAKEAIKQINSTTNKYSNPDGKDIAQRHRKLINDACVEVLKNE